MGGVKNILDRENNVWSLEVRNHGVGGTESHPVCLEHVA